MGNMTEPTSPPDNMAWHESGKYEDIRYETTDDGIAKITICRPEVHNAFRPQTLIEISHALVEAREDESIGVIILTGEGGQAFCSGGDQRVRGDSGYQADATSTGRFHVTDLHVQMRRTPKPIVAMVAGWAIGGGQVLQVMCDLAIAADNARFGQVGPRVGSFDGGFGASLLTQLVGSRKAKEIWFLCRQYDAQQALEMGLVNTVVPLADLEQETVKWCREMLALSPFALRLMKASFHAAEDGYAGIQQLAHDANLLFYGSEEAKEGREAFKAKRAPDFGRFPRRALGPRPRPPASSRARKDRAMSGELLPAQRGGALAQPSIGSHRPTGSHRPRSCLHPGARRSRPPRTRAPRGTRRRCPRRGPERCATPCRCGSLVAARHPACGPGPDPGRRVR